MMEAAPKNTPVAAATVAAGILLVSCGIFSPDRTVIDDDDGGGDGDRDRPAAVDATEPEIVMDNLERAFNERDKDLYETLLDERFWFTEDDCLGNKVLYNDREEELEIMGTRDGSHRGIFDIYRTVEWEFQLIERKTELGRDYPMAFEGDPDGHPDEDWEVFVGRVHILLLETDEDGFRVDQKMTFKLRKGDDGIWRIVRWIDDPIGGGACGDDAAGEESGKAGPSLLHPLSWSAAKLMSG